MLNSSASAKNGEEHIRTSASRALISELGMGFGENSSGTKLQTTLLINGVESVEGRKEKKTLDQMKNMNIYKMNKSIKKMWTS